VIHMERRKFLLGVGGSAIGGGALLGSGAFSRIESQRRVKIEVAKDPDAYLGLDSCPESPNSSYTGLDDSGHLEIDISPENPTDVPENGANPGTGVNSDSFTYFDNLFQICNQGKEAAGIWIDATAREPASDLEGDDDYDDYADDERVIFYNTDDPETRIDSQDDAFVLEVGECKCIGMRVMTKGLDKGDQLLEDDEIVINADTDIEPDDDAWIEIPIREFSEPASEEQFDALEEIDLTDPFALRVDSEELIGEESNDYAVTAFYDEFDESPSDRLSSPTFPLDFGDDGQAVATIGSAGTDADVSTGLAPGGLGTDASLVNNIETPAGTDAVFVGDPDEVGLGTAGVGTQRANGEFTEVE